MATTRCLTRTLKTCINKLIVGGNTISAKQLHRSSTPAPAINLNLMNVRSMHEKPKRSKAEKLAKIESANSKTVVKKAVPSMWQMRRNSRNVDPEPAERYDKLYYQPKKHDERQYRRTWAEYGEKPRKENYWSKIKKTSAAGNETIAMAEPTPVVHCQRKTPKSAASAYIAADSRDQTARSICEDAFAHSLSVNYYN